MGAIPPMKQVADPYLVPDSPIQLTPVQEFPCCEWNATVKVRLLKQGRILHDLKRQNHNRTAVINFTIVFLLDSWTENFVVSLWNNQQMRRSSSMVYWRIPNFTPTCFSNSLPSSGGSYLPQKLLNQYLCCGCIWITICPVWAVVEGCDQFRIAKS
jgi:hypothetical protein